MGTGHHHHVDHGDAEDVVRFGVSMSARLLERFDALIEAKGYTSRSEALRDLIRDRLVDVRSQVQEGNVVGALVLVYDHETRALGDRLTDLQHQVGGVVVSTLHVHLDHRNCLETLALRGPGKDVRDLADRILSLKGVKHGKLIITGSGEDAE